MALLRTILFVSALSGIGAGLVGAAMHLFSVVPLVLQAEVYEGATEAGAPVHEHDHAMAAVHVHDDEEWSPTDGFERNAFTVVAMMLTGFGFALLLVAASEAAGGLSGWRAGLYWGLAGFAVFTLAPGLGLPPELPAMPAADLMDRQLWWVGTAVATAAGLALMAYGRRPWLAGIGIALIVLPQMIGAPQPASYASPIPEQLHHDFVVAAVTASLVFWVLLGLLAGMLRPRLDHLLRPSRPALR
ncbi:MAG: CbtA family protein [Xanthobacteraceae bacterium]